MANRLFTGTKYAHVRHDLLTVLHSGRWRVGERLPSMQELAEEFQVSEWVMERALKLLITEGYLSRRPKKGTYLQALSPANLRETAPVAVFGVMPNILVSSSYYGPLMATFAAEFGEREWLFLPYDAHEELADRLRHFGVPFVLSVAPGMRMIPTLETLARAGFHVVCLGAHIPSSGFSSIATDNVHGMLDGLRFLAQLGHRRVAFLGTDVEHFDSRDRLAGFTQGQTTFALDREQDLVVFRDAPYGIRILVEEALHGWLALPDPPTAIITGGEALTAPLLAALEERGVKLRRDLTLIAFDDVSLYARLATPLTVIRQPLEAMAQRAAHLLMTCANCDTAPIHLTLQPELVVRESCAQPVS